MSVISFSHSKIDVISSKILPTINHRKRRQETKWNQGTMNNLSKKKGSKIINHGIKIPSASQWNMEQYIIDIWNRTKKCKVQKFQSGIVKNL